MLSVVHLAPVLLGDGIRLYGGAGFRRIGFRADSLRRVWAAD
jgi:hypothetical protein